MPQLFDDFFLFASHILHLKKVVYCNCPNATETELELSGQSSDTNTLKQNVTAIERTSKLCQ